MKVDWGNIAALFRTELRMVLRDRRILMTSILLPLLITPLMFAGANWSFKKRAAKLRDTVCHYAVSGPASSEIRTLLALTTRIPESVKTNRSANRLNFEEVPTTTPQTSLEKGDVQLILEGSINSESGIKQDNVAKSSAYTSADANRGKSPSKKGLGMGTTSETAEDEGENALPGTLRIRIIYRGDRDFSSAGVQRLTAALLETRRTARIDLLKTSGFPIEPKAAGTIHEVDLASKGHVAGLALGRGITLALLLFMLTGCAVVATDSLAGEKERGTLETLLTTSIRRVEIIAAKQLVIVGVALLIILIQTVNLLVYVGFKLMPMPANLAAAITPPIAVLLFVLYLPVAVLVASVLLLISGYARSYKEAQMYFFPAFLLGLLPGIVPLLPSLTLRSAMALVPVANIALGARDVLIGTFDWPLLASSWLITLGAALWTTRLTVRALSTEKLITASDTDSVEFSGGEDLFSRHVLRWFAVLWASLLIISNYLEHADLRVQLIVNLVVLFFGASCLMLRKYRLDVRSALALRAPKPVVWLAVIIAVPSGLLTASGLFRFANIFVPISPRMMEQFDQAVLPQNIPFPELLFFLTVMPGIFEEILFRGMLLHGLSRKLRPVPLAIVVGVIFGLFHIALFRFAPTACLGILLSAVTLLTGSIFPAMLWHSLSNASGVLAEKLQIPLTELDPLSYSLGTAILAACFWIIWRNRTPYPGLRTVAKTGGEIV